MKKTKLNFKHSKIKKEEVNRYLIYLLSSILLAGLYFYTTRNLIFSLLLLVIINLFMFLLFERKYLKFISLDKKIHECISFINNFIITLSITKSINSTYQSVYEGLNNNLKEELDSYVDLNIEEKIDRLSNYFNLNIYNFFKKTVKQYIDNGGDLINSSQLLIYDSRRIEASLDEFKLVSKRKLIEFIALWGMTMLILVIVKLALSMFYDSIINMSFYPIAIFIFFLIFLLFLYLFIKRTFSLDFIDIYKENDLNEESKG